MKEAALPDEFIAESVRAAYANEGVRELMFLWAQSDAEERDAICADIQDLLDDMEEAPVRQATPRKRPRVSFDDLDEVLTQVKAHKERLRNLIDKHGGVSEVARKSGIPQPSLSRMLNSGSMPRRATLYRIANALGLPEKDIVGDWVQ
jgi:DNA-binding phage protein